MRRLLHTMLQALIDAEATAQIGAAPHERTDTRTTQRNGSRDKLVAALGVESGNSKSEVSRICAGLDAEVAAWRDRQLDEQAVPYVFLDATYCKARVNRRVVSRAVVIATGVAADGCREVLGCEVGDSENEVFWTGFLRGLRDRGLGGM
jgi:putative transposase